MPNNSKHFSREPKKEVKGNSRKSDENVISLRITDQEKLVLQRISRTSSKEISEILREAVKLWLARRERLNFNY